MADIIRYSVSALRTQATCPARFYMRALSKLGTIKEDPAYPLVFGSAAHEGIEMDLKEGKDPHIVADEYVKRELFDKFPDYDFVGKDDKEKAKLDAVTQKMHRAITNYQNFFAPNLKETLTDPQSQVELTLEMPFRKGVLKGIIDVAPADFIFADWKTGKVPLKEEKLFADPQAKIYYHIAKNIGIPVPRIFNYVYLQGLPTVKTPELDEHGNIVKFKTGPRKGETKFVWDTEDNLKFTFRVLQDDTSVERVMNNYVVGAATAYEQNIIYKNVSDFNCNTCQYRTACPSVDLPVVIEDKEVLEVRNTWDDKDDEIE
jgi:hypothetical protein